MTLQQHAVPLLMPTLVLLMVATGVCMAVVMGTSSAMLMAAGLRAPTGMMVAAAVACCPRCQCRPKCSHFPHSPHLALPCPRRDSFLKVVAASR